MKELQMTIRQDRALFTLDVACASNATGKAAMKRVFGYYDEVNGVTTASCKATTIIKLVSVQMNFICELSENGQI